MTEPVNRLLTTIQKFRRRRRSVSSMPAPSALSRDTELHQKYALPVLLVFAVQLFLILKQPSEAWNIWAPLATAYLFGWWALWLGLEVTYSRLRRTVELLDLDQLPRNQYLREKIAHLREAPHVMLTRSRYEFGAAVSRAEMLAFSRSAQRALQGISYSGEPKQWKGQYAAWIMANQAVARRGPATVVERLFVLQQNQVKTPATLPRVIESLRQNFFLLQEDGTVDDGKVSGIACRWFPEELIPAVLGAPTRLDLTIIDNYLVSADLSHSDTLVLQNQDLVPLQALAVVWDREETDRALQVWSRLWGEGKEISRDLLLSQARLPEVYDEIDDWLRKDDYHGALEKFRSIR